MTRKKIQFDHIPDFKWPRGYKCAVAIGWHVDGEAGPIGADSRNREHLGSLSMAQYGVTTAMPRILEIHGETEVPGSFFVPGYVAENNPGTVRDILSQNHELAYHGYMHENIFELSEEEERSIFKRQIDIFKHLVGRDLTGWSAPGWGVRESTIEIMMEEGFLYDSSLMELDRPYILKKDGRALIELPISMILDDFPLFGASLYPDGGAVSTSAGEGFKVYREEFDGIRHYGGLFTTTFHPCLFGRPGRLRMLQQLFEYMCQFDDVWFATYEEIAKYVEKNYLAEGIRKAAGK